jgi:hypothetical protein
VTPVRLLNPRFSGRRFLQAPLSRHDQESKDPDTGRVAFAKCGSCELGSLVFIQTGGVQPRRAQGRCARSSASHPRPRALCAYRRIAKRIGGRVDRSINVKKTFQPPCPAPPGWPGSARPCRSPSPESPPSCRRGGVGRAPTKDRTLARISRRNHRWLRSRRSVRHCCGGYLRRASCKGIGAR